MTNLAFDDTKHYIGKKTFRIGIGMHQNDNIQASNYLLDETVFKLRPYFQKAGWRNGT